MTAPALRLPLRDHSAPRFVWVIDRKSDLAFLIGGALVAFAFLAAHAVLGVAAAGLALGLALACVIRPGRTH